MTRLTAYSPVGRDAVHSCRWTAIFVKDTASIFRQHVCKVQTWWHLETKTGRWCQDRILSGSVGKANLTGFFRRSLSCSFFVSAYIKHHIQILLTLLWM